MSRLEAEFSGPLVRALESYAPLPAGDGDWQDVLRRAGATTSPPRRWRWFAVAAAASLLVALSLATPLGGAIRDTVVGFSDWLRGTPGQPVSAEEQRAFEEEQARSYAAFPGSPELRRLIRTEVAGVSYDLLGFRSAGSLCIRLVASGAARGSTTTCAPVDDLRNDETPVRVLVADWPVGEGEKTETVGFEQLRAPLAQVTAGIAADGVRAIELRDDAGSHRAAVAANSFLYVASSPGVGQRVRAISAQLADGSSVVVPFTVSPFGSGGGFGGAPGEPGGPIGVERVVHGGRVGWLDRREDRGEPLETLPDGVPFAREAEFGRVITPDPQSSKRVAVVLARVMLGRQEGMAAICYAVVSRGIAGGGCNDAEKPFPTNEPFMFGYSVVGPGDQYATFSGLASDDVARLELFTATDNRIPVALKDNAYLAEIALARFPVKLVAYDARGRVIGIRSTPREEGQQTPVGDPILTLSASAAGGTLKMVAYDTKEGGRCSYARGTGTASVNTSACVSKDWRRAPLRVGPLLDPAVFVYGQVRSDIERITLRYADGNEEQIEPGRYGYVLHVIPPEHRMRTTRLIELVGLDADGEVVDRQRLPSRP